MRVRRPLIIEMSKSTDWGCHARVRSRKLHCDRDAEWWGNREYAVSRSRGGPIWGRLQDRVEHMRPGTVAVATETIAKMADIIAEALAPGKDAS